MKLTIGAIVKFTPLAAAHWREYREGTLVEQDGDTVVVEFEDGTKRTVPAGDVISAADSSLGGITVAKAIENLQESGLLVSSDKIGEIIAGDDESA